ncbi:Domain of uncharacterised function (DUF2825) [Escherichia coli]|nr:Domain of uncharacterised function (DUF2825) [Escherichia coli]
MVVYPRWRGELNIGNGFAAAASGLSPLARGALREEYLQHPQERFIPAGAGNTGRNIDSMFRTTVYPRWRGEHILLGVIPSSVIGLSPLARGTRYMETHHDVQKRFIPAGAGNTVTACTRCNGSPVYPRWRGEHLPGETTRGRSCGLSPLARGTRADVMG